MLRDEDLTDLERELVLAMDKDDQAQLYAKTGDPAADDPANGADWPASRQIRAELLAELLTGARPVQRGRMVMLMGVRVVGSLNLTSATLSRVLILAQCHVDETIELIDARTSRIALIESHLGGLNAQRARIDGSLNLRRSRTSDAVIDLLGAHIDGQLILNGAQLRNSRGPALRANGVTAVQGIFLGTDLLDDREPQAFSAEGVVDLSNASSGWGLDLSGARLSSPRQYALLAERASLTGEAVFENAEIDGAISLQDARISGSLLLTGARITCFGWSALYAPRLAVGQDVRGNPVVRGGVELTDARIDGNLDLRGARVKQRGGTALAAQHLIVGRSVFCADGFHATGVVNLRGTRVGGSLDLGGARFTNPGGIALNANRVTVPGELHGDKSTFRGEVLLRNAQVATVDLSGARLLNPGGSALSADTLRIDRCLFGLNRFTVRGKIVLTGSSIQEMQLTGARLSNPGGAAVVARGLTVHDDLKADDLIARGAVELPDARLGVLDLTGAELAGSPRSLALDRARIGRLSLRLRRAPEGAVDLGNASAEVLDDEPRTWPRHQRLNGFTYRWLANDDVPVAQRLDWLDRNEGRFAPGTYDRLAACYRDSGRLEDARRVAYAKQRRRRRELHWPGKVWNTLLEVTVGYGYRPWLAGVWLSALLAVGAVVFGLTYPGGFVAKGVDVPRFNAFAYALDVVLPVDLGQQTGWFPQGLAVTTSWVLLVGGWILAAALIAGVTNALKRD
ncbi:hypothetical protein [Amycolatopsis granulosa]|uniref:hypothetical protein n=1 Tax=Amycolatopsis granulosa TaxID=185684 RepID=UPI00142432C6|nr:hypothetical protein [Amycolatopsis granulosa]NIH84963.1 hypothetical protein [Amycolatopsis granulosa]